MSDWIGKTLGKVRLDLLLARGGMAEVYLGTHTTLNRPVAVKLMRNAYLDEPELKARFEREARVVAMLRHPNIVQVYDFDTFQNQPYLIMEYVPGVALSTYLHGLHERRGRLEYPVVSRLISIIAHALQYAHENGVVHRDVKPGNIILTSRNHPVEGNKPLPYDVQAVLTDFGLVRILNTASQTATGEIAGTPAYMSPEQARGDVVDARTDIYSLGIILYEILAGKVPFEADSTLGVLMKQINEPPAPIPGLPPALDQVIQRALAKAPEDRYQTPLELARALEVALRSLAESPTNLRSAAVRRDPAPPATKPAKTRVGALPLLFGFGVLAIAGTFLWMNRMGSLAPTITPTSAYDQMTMVSVPVTAGNSTAIPAGQMIGLLRFQDGAASVDEVTVTAMGLPVPAQGQHYEAWLIGKINESRRSLGMLEVDPEGKGALSFIDPEGRNLLERFDTLELTLEPDPDTNPNPSNEVAFHVSLPADSLMHVRHLLVAFEETPDHIGLVAGLLKNTSLLDQAAHDMLTAQQTGDQAAIRRNAESMLNLMVGSQSEDHKDWDSDGTVQDAGDGFGLLLNGDNEGYIEGAFDHADYAATAPGATQNMIVHGEHVKTCTQNMEQWAPQLRDLLKQILSEEASPDMEANVRRAAALADEMLEGTDLNGNEQVEPVPGEGGARTAYQHAFYMADITLLSGQ